MPGPLGLHLPPRAKQNLKPSSQEMKRGIQKMRRWTKGMERGVHSMRYGKVSSIKYSPNILVQLELNFMHKHVLL